MVAAVLLLGTADTIGRLAVLRHSDAVTAASLDAGLSPLASVMAHSTRGLAIHEGRTAGARQGEMAVKRGETGVKRGNSSGKTM